MPAASPDQLEALLTQFKTLGGYIHPSINFQISSEKGIHAIYNCTEPLKADPQTPTEIIKVPDELTLSIKLAEEVFGVSVFPTGNRNGLLLFLLAKLRFDPGETFAGEEILSQKFRNYLDILPTGREIGTPLFWDADERDLIYGTDAISNMNNAMPTFIEEWYRVVNRLPKQLRPESFAEDLKFYENFKKTRNNFKPEQYVSYYNNPTSWTSFPAYLWAYAILTSRGFPYFVNPKNSARDVNEAVLIPVWDLLNHNITASIEWEFNDTTYDFKVKEPLNSGDEVLNNYGAKNNETLLLNYGFVLEKNEADSAGITLAIPADIPVSEALAFGLKLKTHQVSYTLDKLHRFPDELPDLLAYLVKTREEKALTLRNKLKGIEQLEVILQSKIEILKNKPNPKAGSLNSNYVKAAKIYKNTQRYFFQMALEETLKLEKSLLKKYKPLSFKTVYKNDTRFANAVLLSFGIEDYEKLSATDDIKHALLLWVIRVGNKKQVAKDQQANLPEWIYERYQHLLKTYTVDSSQVREFAGYFKSMEPVLRKVPEVFQVGDWNLRAFVIADAFISECTFTREVNNEVFFLHDARL
ncbi:hypothetical protein WICPIJ_009933 [Wickerhamomyces pijperi]|uniref:SET domain-containing protein n=1 Tax=Wickerhamomyces pijperi TaxID=599730 RepID=A0A9P8PKL2_WICPI|nr:hypothetical protein WICPIJ_009933 [Wickerhamomyces pijperi]